MRVAKVKNFWNAIELLKEKCDIAISSFFIALESKQIVHYSHLFLNDLEMAKRVTEKFAWPTVAKQNGCVVLLAYNFDFIAVIAELEKISEVKMIESGLTVP